MKSVADPPDQPLLQIIIVYGPAWDHHSALRLVCPDLPVLFWNPGGGYGIDLPEVVRSKDLITVNPPSLETYAQHIWHFSSIEVEVFEWDLKPEHAHELYDVLLNGTDKNHPAGRFTTPTMGLFCTVAVSDFLHRFAGETTTVPRTLFFPHNLTESYILSHPSACWPSADANRPPISFLGSLRAIQIHLKSLGNHSRSSKGGGTLFISLLDSNLPQNVIKYF